MSESQQGGQVKQYARPQLSMWSIGQGFEGTASDWTEYVVWLVGLFALIFYLWQNNVQAFPDLDDAPDFLDEGEGEEGAEDEDKDKGETDEEQKTAKGDGSAAKRKSAGGKKKK
ncbi:unnamed protein product [Polarella glacialis]|uniref:Uncharacterized protein n=1 Tax=Polarella glacialis TaxID=89957 RepID=A0A813HG09_POLGL|nr:unnamed protein product [Polarella glacialis]CAE8688154.1 unnamed protein product [Polarella glacialis]|mmetsp:Transcript_4359/g.6949  ORF Transcript_4359/g.6949 Transcript_4359/m.6949 type:complete len:114 (+) Transcript_4359:136-477(+)